jgi:hypothetical protein
MQAAFEATEHRKAITLNLLLSVASDKFQRACQKRVLERALQEPCVGPIAGRVDAGPE